MSPSAGFIASYNCLLVFILHTICYWQYQMAFVFLYVFMTIWEIILHGNHSNDPQFVVIENQEAYAFLMLGPKLAVLCQDQNSRHLKYNGLIEEICNAELDFKQVFFLRQHKSLFPFIKYIYIAINLRLFQLHT